VTEELRRLRAQLSSLQSLLTLSKLMSDSGGHHGSSSWPVPPFPRWRAAGSSASS
jgi:hypothetical protein